MRTSSIGGAIVWPLALGCLCAATAADQPLDMPSVWDPAPRLDDLVPDHPTAGALVELAELRTRDKPGERFRAWLAAVQLRAIQMRGKPELAGEDLVKAIHEACRNLKGEGAFHTLYCQEDDDMFVANAKVGVGIRGWERGTPCVFSLYDFASGVEWIGRPQDGGDLWRLDVRKNAMDIPVNSAAGNATAGRVSAAQGSLRITLYWPDVQAEGVAGRIAVQAILSLAAVEPLVDWRLEIENGLKDGGIWTIAYPVLNGIGHRGHTDFIDIAHMYRRHDAVQTGQLWGLQMVAASCGDSTLYMAAHDPKHTEKHYRFEAGEALHLQVFPENMGVPAKDYRQDFPLLIGPVAGDWYDAAQVYRQWALRQMWCAPGPIGQRKLPIDGMSDLALWVTTMWPLGGKPLALAKRVQEIRDHFQVPVAVHWYNWWTSRAAYQPHTLTCDPRGGFLEAARILREDGITPMPYVNTLYWEMGRRDPGQLWPDIAHPDPSFDTTGRPSACRSVQNPPLGTRQVQDHYLIYVNRSLMAPMCRSAQPWQEHLAGCAQRLSNWGHQMVYLDQSASKPRWPCFDASHGHSPGGGTHWAEGTREMIRRIKHCNGKALGLAGEGRFEGHLDLIEVDLLGYWSRPYQVSPLFEVVYGEYEMSLVALLPKEPAVFAVDCGTRLLHGAQARVDAQWILEPKHAQLTQFLLKLLRLKALSGNFLTEGTMLRPPAWAKRPPTMRITLAHRKRAESQLVSVPVLERAAYRARTGAIGLYVVNFDERDHRAALDVSQGLGGRSARAVLRTWDGKEQPLGQISLDRPLISVRAPGREAILITLTPEGGAVAK